MKIVLINIYIYKYAYSIDRQNSKIFSNGQRKHEKGNSIPLAFGSSKHNKISLLLGDLKIFVYSNRICLKWFCI